MSGFLGVSCAVVLHVAFLLFGGLLLPKPDENSGSLHEVELVDLAADASKENQPVPEPSEVEPAAQPAPDAEELIRNLEQPVVGATPGLDAASLAAIGDALLGQAGGGDFGGTVSLASGGRIGGTGQGSYLDETIEKAFGLDELDQKPRVTYQAEPLHPKEMRGKKIEGTVSVLFVVDATGKVIDARVHKSSHPAFEKAAVDAVRRWKFEPAIRAGKRVACKMRVPIRFPAQ